MKTLILSIALLLSISVTAQTIQKDKQKHFVAGVVSGYIGSKITKHKFLVGNGIIDDNKPFEDIIDEALPYLLLEYKKNDFINEERTKTPFGIDVNDWEIVND